MDDLKDWMDEQNYTPKELEVLRGQREAKGKELEKLFKKTMRLNDMEYVLKLLKYE